MKHFEISIALGNHHFTYSCTTVFEAILALADLNCTIGLSSYDSDKFIEILMDMKNGKKLSFSHSKLIICYVEGEV